MRKCGNASCATKMFTCYREKLVVAFFLGGGEEEIRFTSSR